MRSFAYERPRSVSEAFDLLDTYGRDASLLAGGTDLVVGLRKGRISPRIVVDLKRLDDLGPGIGEAGGRFSIMAPTTLREIIADARIRSRLPSLVEAACTVGSVQIRNRATLAGNICNASPAADTAPALLAYHAEVLLVSRNESRRLPLQDFLLGPRRTGLRVGEMVAAVEIPVPEAATSSCFSRLTRRRGVDLATVSLCCAVTAGMTTFAFGAVGPRPFAVTDDSGLLADPDADPSSRSSLLRAFVARASPISDIRGSREYRQAMLLALSQRALQTAIERRSQA
jgi:CO/xanthine dehydrogenase FAD-binding subunit